jgi:hypothetical protein
MVRICPRAFLDNDRPLPAKSMNQQITIIIHSSATRKASQEYAENSPPSTSRLARMNGGVGREGFTRWNVTTGGKRH